MVSAGPDGSCPIWYFSSDHEAFFGSPDPGGIYEVLPGGSVQVIDEVHLGISEDADIDAFEFAWLPDSSGAGLLLAVLFSVDEDDPCTAGDESGGLDPKMIYASTLTGTSVPLLQTPLDDDVDALTLWCQVLEPDPRGACCLDDLTLHHHNGWRLRFARRQLRR